MNDDVWFFLNIGCTIANYGFVKVPEGVTILRDEEGYYFWIADDYESPIFCDRWDCLKNAKQIKKNL